MNTTYKEQSTIALKQRNYSDYERLMLLAIVEKKEQLKLIASELQLKKDETRKLYLELSDIQSMLLNDEKRHKYHDEAMKL